MNWKWYSYKNFYIQIVAMETNRLFSFQRKDSQITMKLWVSQMLYSSAVIKFGRYQSFGGIRKTTIFFDSQNFIDLFNDAKNINFSFLIFWQIEWDSIFISSRKRELNFFLFVFKIDWFPWLVHSVSCSNEIQYFSVSFWLVIISINKRMTISVIFRSI